MKRRYFLRAAAMLGIPTGILAGQGLQNSTAASPDTSARIDRSFAVDGTTIRFFSERISSPVRMLVIADTHLFRDDERGAPYRTYSARMAGAYNTTTHFQTGEPTHPEACFVELLEKARADQIDRIALVGDIFSFPSEAAIEWVAERLATCGIPYFYVAGNHDWHYEGMAGTLEELRATWIEKRLKPLYQAHDPLMAAYDVGDIRILAIDNSHYEILPAQLDFLRREIASNRPLVLTCHIPLYAPQRSIGFGCGHPKWGAETDRNFELERRPQWPEMGHTKATLEFHREVFSAPNMLGVFAGHIHRNSIDVMNGIPQFVTDDNAGGGFLKVEFLPLNA